MCEQTLKERRMKGAPRFSCLLLWLKQKTQRRKEEQTRAALLKVRLLIQG